MIRATLDFTVTIAVALALTTVTSLASAILSGALHAR